MHLAKRSFDRNNVHGQVDRGVESETALVGTEGRVILDTVATVDLEVALVVAPGDTELDNTLGDGGNSESGAELGALSEELAVLESAGELWYVLDVLGVGASSKKLTVVGLLKLGLGGKVRHVQLHGG